MSLFSLDDLAMDDFLRLKKDGYFRVNGLILTIHRTGAPDETIVCASAAEANRLRLHFADGLAGYIESAL